MSANVFVAWSDEEREQLRRLHENGLSQDQIAAHLGRSKNSVSRQMVRMKLAPRSPKTHPIRAVIAPLRAGRTTLPPLPSLRDDAGTS